MHEPEAKDIALHVMVDGTMRGVTYQELALSNNLAQESLVRLLMKKNLITPEELLEEMEAVRKERYRPLPDSGHGPVSEENPTPSGSKLDLR